MTDIESRMDEVEKTNIEHGALLARLTADKNDDAVTSQSAASFSTTGSTSRPTHSQELYSEVQSLRDTVLSMQSTLATPSHPWEIEVVFLPFPLKKLWQGIEHFKPDSATGLASDEWTQTGAPMSLNTSAMGLGAYHNHSPLYDEWSRDTAGGNRHDAAVPAEWLLPRAYPDSSPAGSRLRSRGLVRMVQMRGPDARSVQQAMVAAFGDVLRQMEAASQLNGSDRWAPSSNEYSRLSRRYAGLQSLWVPLRKVHKDSRLRLLSPAEMLNPTSWTVEFLSSVMMKRKTAASRLYVTSPEAYVQDMHAYERGWTWQRIRELSRVPNPDEEDNEDGSTNASANGDGVPEADALESCWARDEQLDDVPGAPPALASLNMRLQRRATTSSPSLRHMSLLGASSSRRSSSPVVLGPVVRERRSMRHSPMPVSIAAGGRHVSPALSGATRRRVSYAASGRHVSPSVSQQQQQQMAALRRRRRRTRSPSYPAFTPRMTASPSPGPVPAALRQQQRATTPFAYATPHSNVAPLQEIRLVGQHSSRNRAGSADFGVAVDELHDIDIYADEPDAYYGAYSDDEDDEDYSLHERQLPEDEPWPGIEDQQRQAAADDMSVSEEEDGENVDPGAAGSDASSLPSEYPSHGPWPEADEGFRIHEDE